MRRERWGTARAVLAGVVISAFLAGLGVLLQQGLSPVLGDRVMAVAGALLLIWPLTYRRSMASIRHRMADRGGDPERFRRHMDRGWIRAALWIAPVVGVVLIVVGLTG